MRVNLESYILVAYGGIVLADRHIEDPVSGHPVRTTKTAVPTKQTKNLKKVTNKNTKAVFGNRINSTRTRIRNLGPKFKGPDPGRLYGYRRIKICPWIWTDLDP